MCVCGVCALIFVVLFYVAETEWNKGRLFLGILLVYLNVVSDGHGLAALEIKMVSYLQSSQSPLKYH